MKSANALLVTGLASGAVTLMTYPLDVARTRYVHTCLVA